MNIKILMGMSSYFLSTLPERRNGKTLLTAEDQAVILETLRKVDIKDEHKFDSYIEAAKIVKLHGLMSPHNRSIAVLIVGGLVQFSVECGEEMGSPYKQITGKDMLSCMNPFP